MYVYIAVQQTERIKSIGTDIPKSNSSDNLAIAFEHEDRRGDTAQEPTIARRTSSHLFKRHVFSLRLGPNHTSFVDSSKVWERSQAHELNPGPNML